MFQGSNGDDLSTLVFWRYYTLLRLQDTPIRVSKNGSSLTLRGKLAQHHDIHTDKLPIHISHNISLHYSRLRYKCKRDPIHNRLQDGLFRRPGRRFYQRCSNTDCICTARKFLHKKLHKTGKEYGVSDKIILFTRTYSQFRFSFIAYPLYVVTPPCAGFTPCKLKQWGVNRSLDFFHDFRHRFLSVWAQ